MSNNGTKRHMSVKRSPHEAKIQQLKHRIAAIQEEREEVINLINIAVDRDVLTAEEALLLDKEKFCKVFEEINSQLECCIEKLLVIKVQLLSEESETKGSSTMRETRRSGSNHERSKKMSNYYEEKEEEEVEDGMEEEEVGDKGVIDGYSKHAIQGDSSMRSSSFLEPSSTATPFSSSSSHHHRHHHNDDRQVEQTNHGDHYQEEGSKQRPDPLSSDATSSSPHPSTDNQQVLGGNNTRTRNSSANNRSTDSFEGHEYVINSQRGSDDNPSSYVINSSRRNSSLTSGKTPDSGPIMLQDGQSANYSEEAMCSSGSSSYRPQQVMSDDESSHRNSIRENPSNVPKITTRAFSNEDMVFRMADERHHQQLGHVPQEHHWTDYTIRLSLPESLDPPENFRDNSHTSEQTYRPRTSTLTRTPELTNITRKGGSDGGDEDRRSEEPLADILRSRMVKQDSSETKTTSSCDKFDTASSEIYFSPDGNSPPDQSLSDSPPLFVASSSKPPLSSSPHPNSSPGQSYRKRTSYPKINIPIGVNLSVRICHVNDPADFWIHVNRDQVNMLYNEIQLSQEKFVQSNHVSVKNLIVGSLYATRYSSDVSWYRVELLEFATKLNTPVQVLFVDYGFTAKVLTSDLAILSPLLEDKPAQAFNCYLKGVQGPTGEWTPKAIEEFKNSVSFYSVRAMFYDSEVVTCTRNKYPVDLFLDWGSGEMTNVLLYLSPTEFITTELNTPKEEVSKEKVQENSSSVNKKTGDLREEMTKERKKRNFTPIFVDAPSIPEKEYILGVISHVVSPSEFYIHIMSEDECDGSSQLDDLREQLNEYYGNNELSSPPVIFPPEHSQLKDSCWAAMFPTDNSWYRVRIIEILEEEDEDDPDAGIILHALVQYVDYGNIEVVTLNELKPLSTDISKNPALAIKCHLAYIKPDGNKWSEEALSFFEQLSGFEQETLVTAHVVYKPNRIDFKTSLSVLLWNNNANNNIDFESDLTDGHDVLINALMVNETLAITDSIEWMEEVEKIHTDQEVSQKVSMVQEATKRILNEVVDPIEEDRPEEDDEVEDLEEELSLELTSFNLLRLAIDSIILLKVTHVESPDEFYGVLPSGSSSLDETECDSLQELMTKIETAPLTIQKLQMCDNLIQFLDQDSSDPSLDTPEVNQVVLVKQDNLVFRGRILCYSVESECYQIQDVDSGAKKSISPKNIHQLPQQFLAIPAFAVECKLANIVPFDGKSWSQDSIETFKRDTEGNSFAAHVISRDDGTLSAELVGLNEDNSISVCEYLVGLGFGKEVLSCSSADSEPNAESASNRAPVSAPVTSGKPPIPSVRKRRGSSDSQESKNPVFVDDTEFV